MINARLSVIFYNVFVKLYFQNPIFSCPLHLLQHKHGPNRSRVYLLIDRHDRSMSFFAAGSLYIWLQEGGQSKEELDWYDSGP